MKRIYVWLMFTAVVVTIGILASGSDAGEDKNLILRVVLFAIIAVLTLWKVGDFWKRHRGPGEPDDVPGVDR